MAKEEKDKKDKEKDKKENIHSGHRDRVRKKFLNSSEGEEFPDHELLEMLLFYAIPRVDTNAIAHNMINEFGSFSALLEAHPTEIMKACKVKEATATLIALQRTISKRYIQSRWGEKVLFKSLNMAKQYCSDALIYKDRECFMIICLDSQNRVTHKVIISEGTITDAGVSPRKVVESAIRYQAVSVIFTHNHPGGNNNPSKEDINITAFLIKVLEPIDIMVLDHIIVGGDGSAYSFKENGLLIEN